MWWHSGHKPLPLVPEAKGFPDREKLFHRMVSPGERSHNSGLAPAEKDPSHWNLHIFKELQMSCYKKPV